MLLSARMRADERKKSSKSRCGRGSRVIGQRRVSVNRPFPAKIPVFPKGLRARLYGKPYFFISAPCVPEAPAKISAVTAVPSLRRGAEKAAERLKKRRHPPLRNGLILRARRGGGRPAGRNG